MGPLFINRPLGKGSYIGTKKPTVGTLPKRAILFRSCSID